MEMPKRRRMEDGGIAPLYMIHLYMSYHLYLAECRYIYIIKYINI